MQDLLIENLFLLRLKMAFRGGGEGTAGSTSILGNGKVHASQINDI